MISPLSSGNSLLAIFALHNTQRSLTDVFRRLSSGRRINSGKDDPAGLIASELLSAEIKSLQAENRAIERADSAARIAEGNAREFSSLMSDAKALVVASANTGGLSDAEIAANQMQLDNIMASATRFHGAASASLDGFSMPDGGNAVVQSLYDNALGSIATLASGAANDLSSGNFAAASTAIDTAILDVATARGRIGGYQKDVLGPNLRSNQITLTNLVDSRSRIADTDFAMEMSNLNRDQILFTAGIKALQLTSLQARSVLDLLR